MVSCEECERYLIVFLDQTLDVKENLDVQEHLHACAACAERLEAERALRAFLRRNLATPPLPQDIQRRIIHQAMQSTPARWWQTAVSARARLRDVAIGVTAAAAVILLIFGTTVLWPRAEDVAQRFVYETSMAYEAYSDRQMLQMPLDVVSTDDKQLMQWFNLRLGYNLPVPCITDKATQLVGGRLCRLLDRRSAALKYQRHGVEILLFAVKGPQMALPLRDTIQTKAGTFYIQRIAGRSVALWQRGGITYSLVGAVDREALVQVATTVDYP